MKNTENELYLVYALLLNKTEVNTIQKGKPLYFSHLDKAVNAIKRYPEHFPYLFEEKTSDFKVYCIIMEQYALNTTFRYQLATWVYSSDGALLSDCKIPDDGPFLGRQKNTICHEIGEIVEFPLGNQLYYGIVVEQPISFNEDAGKYGYTASDDCYGVLRYPENEVVYPHAPLVFKPKNHVLESVRLELQSAYNSVKIENK
jgi:hypothetical protein